MNAIKTAFVMICVLFVAACQDTASLISSKKDAVVVIGVEKNETEKEKEKVGLGTGWFLKENYIVTNYHVVGNSKLIKIAPESGDFTYEAEMVYGDEFADVAVIRIKNWEDFKTKFHPIYLEMVDEREEIKNVQDVYAIGHPWGLFFSISKGIISNNLRRIDPSPRFYLQTDAHIFNGNSGGPLLNEHGKVVGMNDMMIVKEGGSYGVAIPSVVIEKVLNDLEIYKEVRWAVIGVALDDSEGVVKVKGVGEGKPAAAAGVLENDIITAVGIGEKIIQTKTADRLVTEIGLLDYKQPIILFINRNGFATRIQVTPTYNTGETFVSKEETK